MSIQRRTRRLSAAALVLGLGALLLLGPLAGPASAATSAPSLDATFASLLNTLRSTLGLGTLAVDPELSSVAHAWSVRMANSGDLVHNGNLRSQVSGWAKLGENIGTGGTATQIFNALVASPPHMRNMSDRDYTRIGLGTVTDARGQVWTTHVFMRPQTSVAPAPAPVAAAPAPRAPAPARATAPKPTPTTAAPVAAPPATAPPTTVAVPTTVAAPPAEVTAAAGDETIDASPPALDPALTAASPSPDAGPPLPVMAAAVGLAFLALVLVLVLVLGGGAFGLRRRIGSGGPGRTPAPPAEDLRLALDPSTT